MGEVAVVVFLLGGWTLAPKRNLKFGTVFFLSFFFLSLFLLLFFLSVRHFLLFPKSSSQEGGSLASSSVESRDPGSSTEQIDPRAIMKAFIQANSQRKEVFGIF